MEHDSFNNNSKATVAIVHFRDIEKVLEYVDEQNKGTNDIDQG